MMVSSVEPNLRKESVNQKIHFQKLPNHKHKEKNRDTGGERQNRAPKNHGSNIKYFNIHTIGILKEEESLVRRNT